MTNTNTTTILSFTSLFDNLVAKVKTITLVPECIDSASELQVQIKFAINDFLNKLSESQRNKLSNCATEYLASNSEDDTILALLIMLYTHPELDCNKLECTLDNPLDPDSLDINKWEQLENNDWDWFKEEFWNYGVEHDVDHLFLLRIKHVDTTEVECYALYTTSDKTTAKMAVERFAQAFLDGDANPEEECYEYEGTKQFPLEAMEINSSEFRTYSRLNIRRYTSLANIPANGKEVSLMI